MQEISISKKLNYDSAYYCNAKAKLSAEAKDTSRIILSLLNLAKFIIHNPTLVLKLQQQNTIT
jgi:hypothetical protein